MPDSDFRPAPGHGDQVLYAVQGRLGRVRLNRPKAVNALDQAMVDSMQDQLQQWAQDEDIGAVLLDGAGDRGLCAGGDVRALREQIAAGRVEDALGFWRSEYALNALISDYPKPYLAWMDGVVMGGGVGISAHGSTRVVTQRSRLAMPETIIGFFPDVGGLWFLANAPGELGTWAALTGLPFSGADAVAMGLAETLVDSSQREQVVQRGRRIAEDPVDQDPLHDASVEEQQAATPETARAPDGTDTLTAQQRWIDECFTGAEPSVILGRLVEHDEPAAREAGAALAARSPHSVAITLEALRRAETMNVHEVLAQDAVLGHAFVTHPDFAEGVRALLIDKDNDPHWAHHDLESVSREEVLAAFEPPG